MSDESAKSFESFYTLHDDFEPEATGGIRWLVNPSLVRSIECWCQHIYDLEPLDKKLIIDRTHVRQHFDRWCVEVDRVHQLDRETLIESLCQHLFDRLRLYPQDLTIRWHWIAFFMHRCLVVGWKVWRLIPPQTRSIELFQEIILASYAQTANFDQANLLSDFSPGKSQLVSGFRHISVYVDRQIKYSIFPNLRELLGEPNFGRSNLGIAARHSVSKVRKALVAAGVVDIDEYIILWNCFSIYRRETGISVNRLVKSDFDAISQDYKIRSINSSSFLSGADVKTRIEQIGKVLRDSMSSQLVSLDLPVNECQSIGDITADHRQDLLECQVSQERWKIINLEIDRICDTSQPLDTVPSHQQLFWLYYGLGLNQAQIGRVINSNFRLTANPGSVSLRLSRGRKDLFYHIHLALNHPPPTLTKEEVDTTMDQLLRMRFDSIVTDFMIDIAAKSGISTHTQLSDHQQTEFIDLCSSWFQGKISLDLPEDLVKSAGSKIIDLFFHKSLHK